MGKIGPSQLPLHWASSHQTPRVPRTFSKPHFPGNHNHPKLGNSPKLHARFLIGHQPYGVSVTGLLFIDKPTSSAVSLQQVNGATITDLLVKKAQNNAPWQLGWLSHRYSCRRRKFFVVKETARTLSPIKPSSSSSSLHHSQQNQSISLAPIFNSQRKKKQFLQRRLWPNRI